MKELFYKILKEINVSWLLDNTRKLTELELGQTFENYHKAAEFTLNLIKEAGLENSEIVSFPADGKTVYQDKRMPLGWKATKGKLTILKSAIPFEDMVVADYERHPFHLVKGSVSTPPDGLNVRIITEGQLFSGEDPKGCLVMLDPFTWPRAKILRPALDMGAIGIITDFLTVRDEMPHAVQWVAASTEGANWHVQVDDRPFISFSVSPIMGEMIRAAANAGRLTARAECNGVRYETFIPAVTALVPGRQKKELWVMSHLYEPLVDDNSSGIVSSIEIARAIKELVRKGEIPPLEFSLRLVFAMEMYGFAAFASKFKTQDVLGAINTDAMCITKDSSLTAIFASPSVGFLGNYVAEKLFSEYDESNPSVTGFVRNGAAYGDDCFLGDSDNRIPTIWLRANGKWWHNSESDMKIVSPSDYSRYAALNATWIAYVLTMDRESIPSNIDKAVKYAVKHLEEEASRIMDESLSGKLRVVSALPETVKNRMAFRLKLETDLLRSFEEIDESPFISRAVQCMDAECVRITDELNNKIKDHDISLTVEKDKWFAYSASIIPERAVPGFPFDLISVPKDERVPMPEGVIYGQFSWVYSNMDGRKSLQRLLCEAEWEKGVVLSGSQIKKYVTAVSYLSDHGYLKTDFRQSITREDIIAALRSSGIRTGDLLMVHSSLSSLGRIEGGAETVIDAFLEALGPGGTLLMPSFTTSFIYFDGFLNKSRFYRPYDRCNPYDITVGKIPQYFMRRKGVVRSVHPTHSVIGAGALTEQVLSLHKENDAPAGETSPFAKLLDYNGNILHFGSGINATTFLHFIEDKMDLPYLGNAVCRIKGPDGKLRTVLIPKHLPGHRDFYDSQSGNCKFFLKAKEQGLEIKETSLGIGKIKVMDASSLYEIGVDIVKADPHVFLCDDRACSFCSTFKK